MHTARFEENLAALDARQPELAAALRATPIPPGVADAVGRDGSQTFLIQQAQGKPAWFGGSSMPTVSADALFGQFIHQAGNVSLPAVMTGAEALTLFGRLPPHAAVFVFEGDPLNIKLAMHLWDYAEAITSGRLVFLRDNDLRDELSRFYEVHPGYELPLHLLTAPQRTAAQTADLQRKLETQAEAVMAIHARVIESATAKLRSRFYSDIPENPRVAVMSVDPRSEFLDLARRIERGLTKLGWPAAVCVPSRPDRCHTAARMRTIADHEADIVIFINRGAHVLRPLLPPALPIIIWHAEDAPLDASVWQNAGPNDRILVYGRDVYDQAIAGGCPPEQIQRILPAADVDLPVPLADSTAGKAIVLFDLPNDGPEACGITLDSHVALWNALRELAANRVDVYSDRKAAVFLKEAQRISGTRLGDEAVRNQFLILLRTCIAPAAAARAALHTLRASRLSVEVYGRNWRNGGVHPASVKGPIPFGERLALLRSASMIVLPDISCLSVQIALEALSMEVPVLLRERDTPFEEEYDSLASLRECLSLYRTTSDLSRLVTEFQRGGVSVDQRRDAASRVQREHSMPQRLSELVEWIRGEPVAAGARLG